CPVALAVIGRLCDIINGSARDGSIYLWGSGQGRSAGWHVIPGEISALDRDGCVAVELTEFDGVIDNRRVWFVVNDHSDCGAVAFAAAHGLGYEPAGVAGVDRLRGWCSIE